VGLNHIDVLPLLDEQEITSMLNGWRTQPLAPNLAFSTMEGLPVFAVALDSHNGPTGIAAGEAASP